MMVSVALSLSRGGLLTLLGCIALLLVIRPASFGRLSSWSVPALASAAIALALLIWMGFDRVESRLATVWKGEALEQSRMPIWVDSWPLVPQFPLLGTGFGTFRFVEPLNRQHTASIFVHEHAHNEYLEALIEGGILRLAISLAAVILVVSYGYRAVRRHQGGSFGGLALGGLFGFAALALQSAGDFGLHLPAIAVLASVLAAQLMAAGEEEPAGASGEEPESAREEGAYVLRLRGLAPLVGALTAASLALTLPGRGSPYGAGSIVPAGCATAP